MWVCRNRLFPDSRDRFKKKKSDQAVKFRLERDVRRVNVTSGLWKCESNCEITTFSEMAKKFIMVSVNNQVIIAKNSSLLYSQAVTHSQPFKLPKSTHSLFFRLLALLKF